MKDGDVISRFKGATVHARLGDAFYDIVSPADFPKTILRHRNRRWAERMGLGGLTQEQWISHFARFQPLRGSFEAPLALRYHGHQFQGYNPDLGDGRGFLFAQAYDPNDGKLLDFGTKGSGTTPWSRGGDGRLTLKGGVREVLATTMLEALGVETSKSFSLIETGEALYRGDEPSPTRSSVLVRLSHSHIRIGTFQRLDYLGDHAGMARLVDHAIAHYYPNLGDLPVDDRVPGLLGAVAESVARVGAQWIGAGFVHGVINTDNTNITGESFDYGPWRFLPRYDPLFTAAYFDETGLYAFGRQPDALAWNMTRLAECLVPLSSVEKLEPQLNRFWPAFQRSLAQVVVKRLGVVSRGATADSQLLSAFFSFMEAERPAYEQVFFDWRGGMASEKRAGDSPEASSYGSESFAALRALLDDYETAPDANLDHPYFSRSRPRTMLIEEVEAIWVPIAQNDDWSLLEAALAEIEDMGRAYGIESFTIN
ncbi:YdiU family protein [Pelagibacterium sp. 26DY04]|uniref:protein adenylyltransferase SelO n=1 Tax=Pelagibacterium sp. 26DY04 TaxID=2967130 RepID=UPI0028153A8F|nr:YdiU family protein [Pelagibacterium sp. 26DY04]WMT86938.1 YdiU family protein [Pelagibacterium sp. 26DY04]